MNCNRVSASVSFPSSVWISPLIRPAAFLLCLSPSSRFKGDRLYTFLSFLFFYNRGSGRKTGGLHGINIQGEEDPCVCVRSVARARLRVSAARRYVLPILLDYRKEVDIEALASNHRVGLYKSNNKEQNARKMSCAIPAFQRQRKRRKKKQLIKSLVFLFFFQYVNPSLERERAAAD